MKRMVMAGALLFGCATVSPRDDEELMKPVAPRKAAVAVSPKAVQMPVSAETRIDPVGGAQLRGIGKFGVDRGVVTMDLSFTNVPAGVHAVTLQESCDGEHWNPTNAKHGRFDMPPFHLGDVGNFFVNEDGKGTITFSTELWSVGTGLTNDVVDRVVAIHAGKDDFASQPGGGSGDIIGCGRIELSQMTQPAVSMMGSLR
ncbi:MAG: superoxide dismutase family protein [Archangiaceae bacterium]|nr:superoxide dismutase family protein [Archangiaceae bacterium]